MDSVVNALLVILSIAAGFFFLGFMAVRLFHEPRRASSYHNPHLVTSGQIVVPASVLSFGIHRLQIIAGDKNRVFGVLPVERTITVN